MNEFANFGLTVRVRTLSSENLKIFLDVLISFLILQYIFRFFRFLDHSFVTHATSDLVCRFIFCNAIWIFLWLMIWGGGSLVLLKIQVSFLSFLPPHFYGNDHLRNNQPWQNQNTSLLVIDNVINCYPCVLRSLWVRCVYTDLYPSTCSAWLILPGVMVNLLLRKIFHGNLDEAISLAKIDVSLKVTSILSNEIASFRFPRKIDIALQVITMHMQTFQPATRRSLF